MKKGHSNRTRGELRQAPPQTGCASYNLRSMRASSGNRARSYRNLAVFLLAACASCFAFKEFAKPHANPAGSYPANDQHKDERVTVAVDPYDMPDKAAIFTVNYSNEGLLPLFLVISNDSDQAISLTDIKAQLVTVNRTKISASSEDDVYRRLSHPSANTSTNTPFPFPRKKVKGAVSQKARDEIASATFNARAVEPHSTQAGFVFFDVAGLSSPLAGAHFYLTGIRDANGNELMYFEIPMEKYLSAPAKPQ